MKTTFFKIFISAVLIIGFTSLVSCSDDTSDEIVNTITKEELPEKAQSFINKYFYVYTISKIEKDEEENMTLYEVIFEEGYQIVFNSSGDWTQVDAPYGKSIPTGFIPEPILQTLDYQYNGYGIAEINTTGENYHIVLSNNQGGDSIELMFNQSGEIISTS